MSAERNCPRKNFKSIRKKGLKNAKKDPKNDPKRDRNFFSPLRPTTNFSPPIFHQILKVAHRPKFTKNKRFFSPRGSAGMATLKDRERERERKDPKNPLEGEGRCREMGKRDRETVPQRLLWVSGEWETEPSCGWKWPDREKKERVREYTPASAQPAKCKPWIERLR